MKGTRHEKIKANNWLILGKEAGKLESWEAGKRGGS